MEVIKIKIQLMILILPMVFCAEGADNSNIVIVISLNKLNNFFLNLYAPTLLEMRRNGYYGENYSTLPLVNIFAERTVTYGKYPHSYTLDVTMDRERIRDVVIYGKEWPPIWADNSFRTICYKWHKSEGCEQVTSDAKLISSLSTGEVNLALISLESVSRFSVGQKEYTPKITDEMCNLDDRIKNIKEQLENSENCKGRLNFLIISFESVELMAEKRRINIDSFLYETENDRYGIKKTKITVNGIENSLNTIKHEFEKIISDPNKSVNYQCKYMGYTFTASRRALTSCGMLKDNPPQEGDEKKHMYSGMFIGYPNVLNFNGDTKAVKNIVEFHDMILQILRAPLPSATLSPSHGQRNSGHSGNQKITHRTNDFPINEEHPLHSHDSHSRSGDTRQHNAVRSPDQPIQPIRHGSSDFSINEETHTRQHNAVQSLNQPTQPPEKRSKKRSRNTGGGGCGIGKAISNFFSRLGKLGRGKKNANSGRKRENRWSGKK